jgi:hypothetical protein
MLLDEMAACVARYHMRPGGDASYDRYFAGPHLTLDDAVERVDETGVGPIVQFLRDWRARSYYQSQPGLLVAVLRRVWPDLQALRTSTLLSADLNPPSPVANRVWAVFSAVEQGACEKHLAPRQAVAASKLLHVLHPELFVMWDSAVIQALDKQHCLRGALRGEGGYLLFLRMMQDLARRAMHECMRKHCTDEAGAVRRLYPCGHSLAKVIDEYNVIRLQRHATAAV